MKFGAQTSQNLLQTPLKTHLVMETKTLTSSESLELITTMIAQTRQKFERGGGSTFLIWGYVSMLTSAAVWLATTMSENPMWNMLWWAIPALGFPMMFIAKKNHPKTARTYIDRFISYIWIVTGSVAVAFPLAGMFVPIMNFVTIPVETLVLSIAVTITGLTIEFRPLVVGGIISLMLSMLFYFVNDYYPAIFMAMFIASMIIPGHALNCKAKCSKN